MATVDDPAASAPVSTGTLPALGAVRRVLGWVVAAIMVPVVVLYMVVPAYLWLSGAAGAAFGGNGAADAGRAVLWLAIGLVPTALAVLVWRVTDWLPLRRERIAVAGLVGSVLGFISFLPISANPF